MTARAIGEIESRLEALGYDLPPAMAPLTKYRWATRDGKTLHLAGHGPFVNGAARYVGKVGVDVSIDVGYEANRLAALTILRTLKEELGSLDDVVRPLSQTNYVNVGPDLGDEYVRVGNGSTDLWIALWGEDVGCCARMTVGVAELP